MNRFPEKSVMVNSEPIWNSFALILGKKELKQILVTFEKWYMADGNFTYNFSEKPNKNVLKHVHHL